MIDMPFVYMHNTPKGCGRPGWLMKRMPTWAQPLRSDDATHLDGSPIKAMSPLLCESCGRSLNIPSTHDVFPLTVAVFE